MYMLQESFYFPVKKLFFLLDLFPVKHQTGEAASSQQGGTGSGKGEESEMVL